MAAFAVGAAPGESLESNNNHINVTERRDIQTDKQTDICSSQYPLPGAEEQSID